MSLFDSGDEAFKLAIHGASWALNTEMAAYNFIVWRKRGTGWHLLSAIVYGSCAMLEVVQVKRHHTSMQLDRRTASAERRRYHRAVVKMADALA